MSTPSPPDLANVRVLVARTKRAIYGPTGQDLDAEQQLDDDQVKDLVADSIAKLILYTNGLWPYTLAVTSRDPSAGYPIEYQLQDGRGTPSPLPQPDEILVTTQAALDFFFFEFKDKKTSEEISDEGQKWVYGMSARVLEQQLAQLRAERDQALKAVERRADYLVDYVSFIAERDALTSALVEWWVRPSLSYPSGQEVFPNPAVFGP